MPKMRHELIHLSAARRAITKAKDVDEVKAIRDKAEAVRQYARARGMSLEIQNDAAEIKIRCERHGGKILRVMEKLKGRPEKASHAARLSDLGLSYSDSSRWQAVASIPEDTFENHVAEVRSKSEELTTAGFLREARKKDIAARRVKAPTLPGDKR